MVGEGVGAGGRQKPGKPDWCSLSATALACYWLDGIVGSRMWVTVWLRGRDSDWEWSGGIGSSGLEGGDRIGNGGGIEFWVFNGQCDGAGWCGGY